MENPMKKSFLLFLILMSLFFVGSTLYQKNIFPHAYTLPQKEVVKNHPKSVLGSQTTPIQHIVVITMENKSYAAIVGSTNAPYLNGLIHIYSFADDYYAVSHPSLPNYVALIGGSTYGITSDCTSCTIAASNLVDQLESAGKTWKAYMESMPSPCFIGSAGEYAQKHDPFIYFDDIRNNPKRCGNIVPFTQLDKDLQHITTTPNFIWISPNLCNDMHDCSVLTGDTWLSHEVTLIMSSPTFTKQKSLLIITWDEGESGQNNQIPTIFVGNAVKKDFVSHTHYSHYALLHTIESLWHLPPLTIAVSQSPVLSDFLINQ